MKISVENLTLNVKGLPATIDHELQRYIATRCGIKASDVLGYRILKRSIDARHKPDLKLIYSLVATIKDGAEAVYPLVPAPAEMDNGTPNFECKNGLLNPVVIGSGPAGLFCALILAQAGCRPVILERGKDVDSRHEDIDDFYSTRKLNEESNFLFGEGGAGTWSDGKLYTRVRDGRIGYILDTFIKFGAPREIGYFSHPHIGSDKLPLLISAIRDEIIALGGEFKWSTRADTILVKGNVCKGVVLANGETLEAPAVVSACGHSARKFILNLVNAGVKSSLKGFQVGCRIEHPQEFINQLRYGMRKAPPALGSAEYSFASKPNANGSIAGATTFCMCPGGELIPATSDSGQLWTNGMSNSDRDGFFANAAIVTAQDLSQFRTPAEAFAFLDMLEKKTFEAGGGDYTCPAQTAEDFMRGTAGELPDDGSYGLGLRKFRVDSLLPEASKRAIRRAIKHIDNVVPGYIDNGVVVGLETRVSSPVRFDRDPETQETSVANFYAIGEGAGMAGGIMSSAVDGIRIAEAMLRK